MCHKTKPNKQTNIMQSVTIIIICHKNGISDLGSNPGQNCLHAHGKGINSSFLKSTMNKYQGRQCSLA